MESLDKDTIQKAAEEAAKKPHNFNAKERIDYIKRMLKLVQEYKSDGKTKQEIHERVPEFAEEYPYIFNELVDSNTFDKTNMDMMLNLMEKMHTGSLNQHQASIIVGDRLLKKYHKSD